MTSTVQAPRPSSFVSLWARLTSLTARLNREVLVTAAWLALVVLCHLWGEELLEAKRRIALHAPPLFGRFAWRPVWGLTGAAAIALVVIFAGSGHLHRLSWKRLIIVSISVAALFAAALAASGGVGELTSPLLGPHAYLRAVRQVGSPLDFLNRFTERIGGYPTHIRGHPPGTVLVLWGLDRIGLGGAGWAAALMIAVGASAAGAALLAAKEIAGEQLARKCAPFLILTPAAIWIATSADALFAGVGAWGVALFVLATGKEGRAADSMAFSGGALLGAALFLSYGIVPLGGIVLASAVYRRRLRPLVIAAVPLLLITAGFAAGGFWWLDGLRATLSEYHLGVSRSRPTAFFAVNNLAAFSIAIGPAVWLGISYLRRSPMWLIVGSVLVAIVAADITGLSKGEVERIWLPFIPWLTVAVAAIPDTARKRWLVAQALLAIGIQTGVATPW
ncbi:MAG: hypothetical protein H0W55_00745 [Actinobacteria bacterium]|nr:hypothetical protein [Actinomycetota bacterium]MDQ3532094.1 hypothetical protein [Actinomycetota bacterium]